MTENINAHPGNSNKSLFGASIIFATIIVLVILLSGKFNPSPLLFSEDFENAERNQQYLPCAAFTIEQGRLRVTVAHDHSGCAVRLPNEYDDFTFTASVYPVKDVYDGSINVLFEQNDNGGKEIQFRPNLQQINYIETAEDENQVVYIKYTSGWVQTPGIKFNNSDNKIKLTVTQHDVSYWINDYLVFNIPSQHKTPHGSGIIKIGAGAGEAGGIAFEFDDIEIHGGKPYYK